jgi:hypothetical protein
MSNKNKLKAQLQSIASVIDRIEAEYDKGMIDFGRYIQMKTTYETRKSELEQELDNLKHGQQTPTVTAVEHLPVFHTGGALSPEYPYYVLRQADQVASRAMDRGKFVYAIAPRQMGKTSLLYRLAARLKKQKWHCCFVDLASLKKLERPTWFQELSKEIADACQMNAPQSPLENQRHFRTFLLDYIGLKRTHPPIKLALFLDEVEGLLELDFSDEFLMMLRDLYQQRHQHPGQFLVAFAGSIDPEVLVENQDISPFNIAEEIVLDDFAVAESLSLTSNLTKLGISMAETVPSHIYGWTSGQPHLTQRICEIIEGRAETGKITSISTAEVDEAVHSLLAPRSRDSNIKHVLKEIKKLKSFPAKLWERLSENESVYSAELGFYTLYLTGAIRETPDGQVRIRNRIYKEALRIHNNAVVELAVEQKPEQINLDKLRQILTTYFDESELRDLYFDLGIEYGSLQGESTRDKARELISYLKRRGRIFELLEIGKQQRPGIHWNDTIQETKSAHPS